MPRATVSIGVEKHFLESIEVQDGEERAWVELRRMSFGEKMEKDAEALKMQFSGTTAGSKDEVNAEVSMVSAKASILEIQRCVVDHNLDDGADPPVKLDFRKVDVIRMLDPRVGQEISDLIGEMNDFEKRSTQSPGVDSKGK